MEWLALIIPFIAAIICFIFFKTKVTPLEFVGLLCIPSLLIVGMYFIAENSNTTDTLYRSENIVSARYVEYYSTWVDKTCTETYSCNCRTDSKGSTTCQTCTRTYDCSYCDENSAYWYATTEYGKEIKITEAEYNRLRSKWNTQPQFVELNRNIDYSGGCGDDGDAYDIFWNTSDIFHSETATWEVSYDNRAQSANSAFHYPEISDKDAEKLELYKYPNIYNGYRQWNIIGSENLCVKGKTKDSILTLYNYYNGYYGKRNKIHLYVLIYRDKPIDIAFQQEAYWNGGNENEIVVCIGVDKRNNIKWCKPFSWCDEKLTTVNIRNHVIAQKRLNLMKLYPVLSKEVSTYYKHKDLDKDFDYVTIDLTEGEIVGIWIMTLIVTIGLTIGFVTNSLQNEEENNPNHPWNYRK